MVKKEQVCYNIGAAEVAIRKAVMLDLPFIKRLADQETKTLGFTIRGAIAEGIELGYIFVAETNGEIIGFQQYYHRKKDLTTTLYRKTVAKEWRRKGIGELLVDAVVEESIRLKRKILILKCPVDNESNLFHLAYGFKLIRVDVGKRRRLNVYEYKIQN